MLGICLWNLWEFMDLMGMYIVFLVGFDWMLLMLMMLRSTTISAEIVRKCQAYVDFDFGHV